MANLNKLRAEKNMTITIYMYSIIAIIFIGLSVYVTYVYLNCADAAAGIMDNLITTVNVAFSTQVFNYGFSSALLIQAIKMQVTELWWLYLVAVLIIFLMATSKNPNEFRGVEHGSARWAEKHEEKEFRDSTGIPIANNFYATVTNPGKKYYSSHNLNECVIGGSGAGKSFRKIKPDIIQMFGSYVVTDPKGELYRDTAKLLTDNGYKIRVLNLIDITMSNAYNPFKYMTDEQDVLDIADLFMKNSAGEGEKEDFWVGSAQDLLVTCMIYLFKSSSEIKSFGRVLRMINSISYDKNGKLDQLCEFCRCLNRHAIEHPNDAATINYRGMGSTPQETMGSIVKTLATRLRLYALPAVDELTTEDEMDFDMVGVEKTAIFLIIPAARQTYKAIANIFYSQLFERLMYIANNKYSGRLPLLVSCELDEFANIGKIPNFNETLAVVRSHNIRLCIVLQGLSQLKALYDKTWESIIGNCSLFTYLGTNDTDTKEYVVKRLGKVTVRTDTRSHNRGNQGGGSDNESFAARDLLTVDEIAIAMKPKGKSKRYGGCMISFIDEYRPFFLPKFDTLSHPKIGLVGSSFEKDFHNNTDISKVYGVLRQQRREDYEKRLAEWNEKNKIDLENATAAVSEQAEKENAADRLEQIKLKEMFESAQAEALEENADLMETEIGSFEPEEDEFNLSSEDII